MRVSCKLMRRCGLKMPRARRGGPLTNRHKVLFARLLRVERCRAERALALILKSATISNCCDKNAVVRFLIRMMSAATNGGLWVCARRRRCVTCGRSIRKIHTACDDRIAAPRENSTQRGIYVSLALYFTVKQEVVRRTSLWSTAKRERYGKMWACRSVDRAWYTCARGRREAVS